MTAVMCSKHNVPKKKNAAGSLICSRCNLERNRAKAAMRRESGIPPSPCPQCGGFRYWGTTGGRICPTCRGGYHKKWREDNPDKAKDNHREWYKKNKKEIAVKAKNHRDNNKERLKEARKIYIQSLGREYWVWKAMNDRCHNSNNKQYPDYGGRGISVHPDWRRDPALSREDNHPRYLSYKAYIDDQLGERPSADHSIDRKDNNKGYAPGNLRWASRVEQNNNRRNSVLVKKAIPDTSLIYHPYGNLTTIKEFAERVGLPLVVVKYRYSRNWDAEWILNAEHDSRFYEYNGHKYKMTELCLLSNVKRDALHNRINVLGWSVDTAMNTPHRVLNKRT